MKKIKVLMTLLFMMSMVLGIMTSANALTITPTTGVLDLNRWEGTLPANPKAEDIGTIIGGGTWAELYKQDTPNEGEGYLPDSGYYAPYYTTTFSNEETDPEDALIHWIGGENPYISSTPIYLLVKDGASEIPIWYLFNLTALGWDGKADIDLQDFWPQQGAISHVALYGPSQIPEPVTLILLGLGLIGMVGIRKGLKK